jgi:hypothetical protein
MLAEGAALFRPTGCWRSLDVLDPDPAPFPQAIARLLDAMQEPRVVFELAVEPIILGGEAYQHSSWFPVAGYNDCVSLGFAQKPE